MAASITERAQNYAFNPPSKEAIEALARDARAEQDRNTDMSAVFDLIATAWAKLPEDTVRPPDPVTPPEALIPNHAAATLNQIAPAIQQTNRVQEITQTPTAASEGNIFSRIWNVAVSAIKTFVTMVVSFLFCIPRPRSNAPTPQPVVEPEAPIQPVVAEEPLPQAPLQPPPAPLAAPLEAQPIRLGGEIPIPVGGYNGRVVIDERLENKRMDCYALSLIEVFWNNILNGSAARIPVWIDGALAVGLKRSNNEGDALDQFHNVEKLQIKGSDFKKGIQLLEKYARTSAPYLSAAILEKDLERHILLIDSRVPKNPVYFHIDLQKRPTQLQVVNGFPAITAHCQENIAAHFGYQGYVVKRAQ